ncbi:hypothetical protein METBISCDRAFT_20584 [Metschnikowia bicuspidata]|uniref:Homoserine dehydrogenase n=1 Tax=Metschnikowia bicuspidata TaxID=27322 RepID=A0A4P9Z8A1_9ASCO|nr:hypothetical protein METBISCDRAFT_20584 [Metschnikowia bicuspidata]
MSVNIAIIGAGVVGSAFLKQLKNVKFSVELNVVYLARNSREALYSSDYTPVNLNNYTTAAAQVPLPLPELAQFLKAGKHPPILVDNTSNPELAAYYPEFIKQGISIATPNKKAFSSELSVWDQIFANSSAPGGGLVYHEATVGAALPIIGPLNDLVLTGDKIKKIEGILSGSLSYIFNSLSTPEPSTTKFSDVVNVAKDLGFLEPDPRDDLNGMDFARKVTILARIAGFKVESPTAFPVDSLVPKPLEACTSGVEFLQKLPEYDNDFQKRKDAALAEGKVLRYVGQVDLENKSLSVGISKYPFDHPFSSLKGADNIIAITTERYTNPSIIQGAGAGADITAHGVLADMLKIAQRVAK